MLAKEVFLKKMFKHLFKHFVFFLILNILSFQSFANEENYKKRVSDYLLDHKEFSSSFLQVQKDSISEGNLFIKNNRLRVEYFSPSNILFIMSPKKAMYFNKDLQEVEYFNPNKTTAKIFLDLFYNSEFIQNSKIIEGQQFFYLSKEIIIGKTINKVDVYFEDSPLKLRKIEVLNDSEKMIFTIINPNHNPELKNDMFSMAHPLLS